MTSICTTTFESKLFTFNPMDRVFSTDASDLDLKPGQVPYSQIYDDAVDAGMIIVSQKTGYVAMFYLAAVVRDADCDVVSWLFTPTTETLRARPELEGWKAMVFND